MFRDGGHLLGHITINVLKAVPGSEGAPDFVSPDATAENDAGIKDAFPRQLAGKAMGRMSVKFLIQRIDLGWSQANEDLDESLFDSRRIDFVRRVRFATKDHVFYSQDTGGTESLLSSHFSHPLLREREWIR